MATSKRLRNAGPSRGATDRARLTRTVGHPGDLGFLSAPADVRGVTKVITMTLQAAAGTDTFKLRVLFADGSVSSDSDAFDDDEAAADIQSFLRTATGDSGLTVSEPSSQAYTITPSGTHGPSYEIVAVACVACSVQFTRAAPTYMDATGKVSTANRTASTPGDTPGKPSPLGTSVVTNGVGQTAQTDLLAPVIDSAVGGDDQVVISGTEVASGGTNAVVAYEVYRTSDGALIAAGVSEDADGDVTITGLESAVNYYVVGTTMTAPAAPDAERERSSRPSAPVFFTTT